MSYGVSEFERQLNELAGALDLLFELGEEFAQWVEEAEDGSKREALENVLGHIEALESEYRNRREQVQKKTKSTLPRCGLVTCKIRSTLALPAGRASAASTVP